MSFFQVTSNNLRSKADELKALNNKLNSEIETLATCQTNLKSMWEGEANNAFNIRFNQDKSKFINFKTAIEQYIEALKVIASKYDIAENKNTATASRNGI